MSMTLGRMSGLRNPTSLVATGHDELAITFDLIGTSLAQIQALRHQLAGMRGDLVPFTFSNDDTHDGYYYVAYPPLMSPNLAYLSNFLIRCSVTLQRAARARNAFELIAVGDERDTGTYDPNATNATGLIALPSAITFNTAASLTGTRATATGALGVQWGASDDYSALDAAYRFTLPPADYYDGAATIEWNDGSNWYPLHGRVLPLDVSGNNDLRIGNGFIRATWDGSDGGLLFEVWDGTSTWDTVGTFEVGTSVYTQEPRAVQVLRNDPTDVTVEWFCAQSTSDTATGLFTQLHIQRGQAFIEIKTQGADGSSGPTLRADSTIAVTDLSPAAGVVQTAAGAAGHKFILASEEAVTTDNTNGAITIGTVNSDNQYLYPFMLGVSLDAQATTTDKDYFAEVVQQYWTPIGTTQRAVS